MKPLPPELQNIQPGGWQVPIRLYWYLIAVLSAVAVGLIVLLAVKRQLHTLKEYRGWLAGTLIIEGLWLWFCFGVAW